MQQTDLHQREQDKLAELAGEVCDCSTCTKEQPCYCPDYCIACEIKNISTCQGTGLKHPGLSRECTACHPGGTCPVNHWQNLGRSEILRCNYCVKVCRECKHERFASGRVPVSVAEARRWVVDRLLEKYEGLAIGDTDVGVAIYHMWYDSDGDLKVSQLAEEDTPALALFVALKWAEEI